MKVLGDPAQRTVSATTKTRTVGKVLARDSERISPRGIPGKGLDPTRRIDQEQNSGGVC